MYFHPFQDQRHYTGMFTLPSWVSLHGVSPRTTGAHYKYLWKMGAASATFAKYTQNGHRIYVMGHCVPGGRYLTTETGTFEQCYYHELADMLSDHGLPVNSSAHIRIHACHSAAPSAAGANDSFAELLKTELTNRNYNSVTVRGYTVGVGIYLGWRWGGWEPANNHAVDF